MTSLAVPHRRIRTDYGFAASLPRALSLRLWKIWAIPESKAVLLSVKSCQLLLQIGVDSNARAGSQGAYYIVAIVDGLSGA